MQGVPGDKESASAVAMFVDSEFQRKNREVTIDSVRRTRFVYYTQKWARELRAFGGNKISFEY